MYGIYVYTHNILNVHVEDPGLKWIIIKKFSFITY